VICNRLLAPRVLCANANFNSSSNILIPLG
jgi:hypothetical protein